MEIKTWILYGLIGGLFSILGWILNNVAQRTLNRLDAILTELQKLNNMLTRHEEKLEQITEKLHEHDERIKYLEQK